MQGLLPRMASVDWFYDPSNVCYDTLNVLVVGFRLQSYNILPKTVKCDYYCLPLRYQINSAARKFFHGLALWSLKCVLWLDLQHRLLYHTQNVKLDQIIAFIVRIGTPSPIVLCWTNIIWPLCLPWEICRLLRLAVPILFPSKRIRTWIVVCSERAWNSIVFWKEAFD